MSRHFNTGRVLIGSNYFKDTRPQIWGDMLTLQSALLDPSTHRKQNLWVRIINRVWRLL